MHYLVQHVITIYNSLETHQNKIIKTGMLSDYIAHTFIHGSYNNSTPGAKYRTKVIRNNKLKNGLFFLFFLFVFPTKLNKYFKLTMYLTNIIHSNAICIILYNNIPRGL